MPREDHVTDGRLAYLRLHGRDAKAYLTGKTVATRFHYDYSDAEIAEVSERALGLGALNALGGHRRDALWAVESPLEGEPYLFDHAASTEVQSSLVQMDAGERLQADFDGMNLTTGPHPMALLRPYLPEGTWSAAELVRAKHHQTVRIAGNVICRQRPGTAKGFVFISLEDETGIANAIVAPDVFEQLRLTITEEAYLLIEGRVQIAEGTIHVKATGIEGLKHEITAHAPSHDFH